MGNSNGQANDMVSVYLNYGEQTPPEGWHVCAQFALAISNPNDPTVYIQSRAYPIVLDQAKGLADLSVQRPIIVSTKRNKIGVSHDLSNYGSCSL